jgi:hypothetical protein
MNGTFSTYEPALLPRAVVDYLDARDEDRHDDAVAVFAADAAVLDEGRTHRGVEAIGDWIRSSSTEYTFTSTRLGQHVSDDGTRAVVRTRLEGNFPGGVVTLRHQFELDAGRITRLAIEV